MSHSVRHGPCPHGVLTQQLILLSPKTTTRSLLDANNNDLLEWAIAGPVNGSVEIARTLIEMLQKIFENAIALSTKMHRFWRQAENKAQLLRESEKADQNLEEHRTERQSRADALALVFPGFVERIYQEDVLPFVNGAPGTQNSILLPIGWKGGRNMY